jgi:hypothetical protein
MAYNFRFIFREYLEDKFIKTILLKAIEPYLFDEDLSHRSEVLISVLLNIKKINDDFFLQTIIQNTSTIFENYVNINDFIYIIKLFEAIVVELSNINMQVTIYGKALFNVVKLFIKVTY